MSADVSGHGVVQCSFILRTPSAEHPGMFDYMSFWLDGWHRDGRLHTAHPPLVGDTVSLYDREKNINDTFRVVERRWSHMHFGSPAWPHHEPYPREGRPLDILVVPAEELFRDEAPSDDTEGE